MNAREIAIEAANREFYRVTKGSGQVPFSYQEAVRISYDAILKALADKWPDGLLDLKTGEVVKAVYYGWTCSQHYGMNAHLRCDHGQPCGSTYRLVTITDTEPDTDDEEERAIREQLMAMQLPVIARSICICAEDDHAHCHHPDRCCHCDCGWPKPTEPFCPDCRGTGQVQTTWGLPAWGRTTVNHRCPTCDKGDNHDCGPWDKKQQRYEDGCK